MAALVRPLQGKRTLGLRVGTPLNHATTQVIDVTTGETIDGVTDIEFPKYRPHRPYSAKVTIEVYDLEIEPYAIGINDFLSSCETPMAAPAPPPPATEAPEDTHAYRRARLISEEEVNEKIEATLQQMTKEMNRFLSEAYSMGERKTDEDCPCSYHRQRQMREKESALRRMMPLWRTTIKALQESFDLLTADKDEKEERASVALICNWPT